MTTTSDPGLFAATPAPTTRLSDRRVWDESERPAGPPPDGQAYSQRGRAVGRHLVQVHDHLRGELAAVRDLLGQVRDGSLSAGDARGALSELTMRQNNWTLGAYCAAYCTM